MQTMLRRGAQMGPSRKIMTRNPALTKIRGLGLSSDKRRLDAIALHPSEKYNGIISLHVCH